MALQKCHECEKDVSSEAKNCPNCGAPVKLPKILTKQPKMGSRGEIGKAIALTELEIGRIELQIKEIDKEIERREKGSKTAGWFLLIGLFLIPIGIGVIFIIMAIIAISQHKKELPKQEENRAEKLHVLDNLHQTLANLKGRLAYKLEDTIEEEPNDVEAEMGEQHIDIEIEEGICPNCDAIIPLSSDNVQNV